MEDPGSINNHSACGNRNSHTANHMGYCNTRADSQAKSNGDSHAKPESNSSANCHRRSHADGDSHPDSCTNRNARAYGNAHRNAGANGHTHPDTNADCASRTYSNTGAVKLGGDECVVDCVVQELVVAPVSG